ncbi:SDR family NAD(P)-dependent oxidoreductase [Halodesulfovibrio marinisediminis]|uniref:Short-chain dehydrogenase n=1 Tax=Halodesulfovibrio marinisediminis DSM 17456 TaxID=1121457 RepID=A0A1N6DVN9_9BACT|nr:SDR family NAD(P)-dependent oxidoreductase [Halodesulfovibrio marinisediminis]SIN74754.1 Short-chain dehydrogenase [Halodesulfovibrio marinisediminis DSM 17456]
MQHVQTIWLTGATSGIGEALVTKFIAEGKRVALTARNAQKLSEMISQFNAEGKLMYVAADVRNEDALRGAYELVREKWGVPDLVMANAGTHINMPASQISIEACRQLFEINLYGAVNTLLVALPDMLERGSGHLVGVGSLSSYRGLPWAAAYGATKAGLNNFLQSLRFDVEPYGLTVTAVNPGFVKTQLTDLNPFPMPLIISSERAAEYIWDGLSRKKMEIHFPPLFSWACKAMRVLPYPLYHMLIRRITGSGNRRG